MSVDHELLRNLYAEPRPTSLAKVQYKIDQHCREFIGRSPFIILGTDGDVSPKGDFPGFVEVIDDNTIAIPDRSGNNRLDSYSNILKNPRKITFWDRWEARKFMFETKLKNCNNI